MPYTVALVYERKKAYLAKGFSVDECAELEDNETIDALTSALQSLGHTVVQVGDIKDLVACLAINSHQTWDLVFSTSEGLYGLAREAQVPALLEAYEIPFVGPDAASTVLCHDKSKTKLSLEHFSIPTAPWCLVRNSRDSMALDMCDRIASAKRSSSHADALSVYPLFAKPVAEGTSKGIYPCSKVERQSELEQTVSLLSMRYPGQDILIESYLAGREFTVGIVGTGSRARVIGVLEFRFHGRYENDGAAQLTKETDFITSDLKNTYEGVDGVSIEEFMPNMEGDSQVQEACERALQAYTALGCRDFGRVDDSGAIGDYCSVLTGNNDDPGLVIPILPFALREVAHVFVQDIQRWTSILLAAYGAGAIIGALVTGYWADHDGSRRMAFLSGLLILAASMLAFFIGHSITILIVGRLIQGASAASVHSIGTAILADAFTDQGMGLAMGVLDLSMALGTVSGPVVGGLVCHYYGYRAVFLSSFILIALDLALRLLMLERDREDHLGPRSHDHQPGLKDPQDTAYSPSGSNNETSSLGSSHATYGATTNNADVTPSASWSVNHGTDAAQESLSEISLHPRRSPTIELLLMPRMQVCLLGDFVENVIITGLESVLPLQLKTSLGYNSKDVALVLMMLAIPSFGGPLVGYIGDRYGPKRLVFLGFAGLSPLLVMLRIMAQPNFEQVNLLCVLLLMVGVCLNVVLTPLFLEVTYLVDERAAELQHRTMGPRRVHAQAYALMGVACASGSSCGPLLGGLKDYVGWTSLTLGAGLICAFCAILSCLVLGRKID
ncbi:MAG: hypothetical protein L6R38_001193 [Xanthoria sp. 2 TBL-2021]|nr:MAG: hypothetical protein L6R38_001193 [Xanthoria sp. 2 TBL-2021]